MKKIVALVLSLVMALSLCTVAFAAVKDGDKVYGGPNKGDDEYTYHAASKYEAGKQNNIAYLSKGGAAYEVGGDTALYLAGGKKADITLGDEYDEVTDYIYLYTGTKVAKSNWSCTTDKYDAGYKYVDEFGDDQYAKDAKKDDTNTFGLLVNGKIVEVVQQDVIKGVHALTAKGGEPAATDKVGIYEAYCVACGKTILVSKTKIAQGAYLYNADDAWETVEGVTSDYAIPAGHEKLTGTWYVVDAKGATKTDKDGVTSAKTFDAGVAMYVGMSLLSVAGGAVVIGKKKEF